MNKKVGVVIATYNGEKYIEEQLKSILNQTVKPNEIIISDANSKDGTVNLCENLLKNTNVCYKILKSKNQIGVSENFEKAVRECDSDFIFFSDQDDLWVNTKIETMLNEFNSDKDICMVFTNAELVNEKLENLNKSLWEFIGFNVDGKRVYNSFDYDFLKRILKSNCVTGMCMAITKELKNYSIPFSKKSLHDVWIANLAICFGRVVAINKKCVLYRQHDTNVIGSQKSITKSYHKRIYYYDKIKNRYDFIVELLEKNKDGNENIKRIYLEYLKYLNDRINYIDSKSQIIGIKQYFNYEKRPIYTFLKDFYIKNFIRR